MRTTSLDSLHCFVEIVDGRLEEGDSIVVEYYLNCGPNWKALRDEPNAPTRKMENVIAKQSDDLISGGESARRSGDERTESSGTSGSDDERPASAVHGCTRKSVRDANNRCAFNHLFELNFEFEQQSGQETQPAKSEPDDARPDRKRDRAVLRDRTNDGVANDLRDSSDDRRTESGQSGDDRAANDEDRIENDKRRAQLAKTGSRTAKSRTDRLLSEWPYFELRVWNIDRWKRKTFHGLALLSLPQKPGQYTETVDVWSPTPARPKAKLMQYFLGYSLEPKSRLTDKSDWRISLSGQAIGHLKIKLNLVLCRHMPSHLESEEFDAIEEKIQRVVVAFRDARKRMQFLLRNKENVRLNRFEVD